jgi:nitrogen regulatory protein P-II 1
MSDASSKELLCCFVKKEQKIEEILTGFLDLGITGATVLDGRGMGEIISVDVPIFAGLRSFFPRGNIHTFIILSVLEHNQIDDAISLIHEVCGNLAEPGTGIVFTLPLTGVYGLAHEI